MVEEDSDSSDRRNNNERGSDIFTGFCAHSHGGGVTALVMFSFLNGYDIPVPTGCIIPLLLAS